MYRWERRLKDLGHILSVCGRNYFEPDLFRLNTNQFLTTARTVTFLIQKEKASIGAFDEWYSENVLEPWRDDPIMVWAKDSRNQIEKQGDLELNSAMSARLIYSHSESEDIVVSLPRPQLLRAGVKRLLRFAEKRLPTGIAETAVIKIERRWVANSLPNHELLHAMKYVYGRLYSVCATLARHLESMVSRDVPSPTDFDDMLTGDRMVLYVKYRDRVSSHATVTRVHKDPRYEAPPWVQKLLNEAPRHKPVGISQVVALQAERSSQMFQHDGYHVPMIFLFDRDWEMIDFMSFTANDQAEKYLFWRSVGDRIEYLNAEGLIFVCEMWLRDMSKGYPAIPMSRLPITGEFLSVAGLDRSGQFVDRVWRIERASPTEESKPSLIPHQTDDWAFPNILIPARTAFERISARRSEGK